MNGAICDLVFFQREGLDRWDAYFVEPQGLVVMWFTVRWNAKTAWILVSRYTDFSTESILPETFLPSEALLKEAKTWRLLTDAESRSELEAELGQKIDE